MVEKKNTSTASRSFNQRLVKTKPGYAFSKTNVSNISKAGNFISNRLKK